MPLGILAPYNFQFSKSLQSYYTTKLEEQLALIDQSYGDKEVQTLWERLKPAIPGMFEGLEVTPCLMHGDLWSGNIAQADGQPGIALFHVPFYWAVMPLWYNRYCSLLLFQAQERLNCHP